MITHRIEPYVEKWERRRDYGHGGGTWEFGSRSTPATVAVPGPGNITHFHIINKFTTKVNYARWLGTLAFKRGDYVCHVGATTPYNGYQIQRVEGLQEIQMFLQFDHKNRPLALKLVSRHGTAWHTAAEDYRVIDVEEVPEEFRFDLKPEA